MYSKRAHLQFQWSPALNYLRKGNFSGQLMYSRMDLTSLICSFYKSSVGGIGLGQNIEQSPAKKSFADGVSCTGHYRIWLVYVDTGNGSMAVYLRVLSTDMRSVWAIKIIGTPSNLIQCNAITPHTMALNTRDKSSPFWHLKKDWRLSLLHKDYYS